MASLITAGVPQGAVLSPTLFSIFINDIPKTDLKNISNSLLFADDLSSFFIYKSFNSKVKNLISKHLRALEEWLCKWRLSMAPSKCNFILFSRLKKSAEEEKFEPKLFGENICSSLFVNFLGIRFDSKLTFSEQVSYLKESCTKRLNILKILSNKSWNINKVTLVKIYILLIRSILDYSSIISSNLNQNLKSQLQTIQNSSLKIIFKKPFNYNTIDLHKLANIDLLDKRFSQLNKRFIFRNIINKNQLIIDTVLEFLNYSGARNIKLSTPLCSIKQDLSNFFSSFKPP